ncbi:hypothetical protein IAG41_11470 [Sphingomonas sp. JC676]|uniref:hypothetical protein n=1 Tax=Sphingomonas sp. JC676 TaxID=2768065 RepID=UPI001658165A|nr:hypothetical protein [Sphingomonas sp. JC676]MBC9033015.1 hypothetical protein [Sphingomonas sp. JC676]
MAVEPHSAPDGAWNTQYENYLSLTQKLDQAKAHECDALERAIAAAQDDLLDTPSPSFTAIARKLEILFEGEVDGLDPDSEAKRLILEDLTNLIQEQSLLLGCHLSA